MGVKRKIHTAEFKARVALEAVKGRKTINEMAAEFQIHPNLITGCKKQLLAESANIFSAAKHKLADQQQAEELQATLYQQIGQLKVEVDFLKKKVGPYT